MLDMSAAIDHLNRMRFRLNGCANRFSYANWLARLGHEGQTCPEVDFEGGKLPAYVMCDDERAELARRAVEKHDEACKYASEWLGGDKIEMAQAWASLRDASNLSRYSKPATESAPLKPGPVRSSFRWLFLKPSSVA
jgi:hypothetical protein